MKTKYLLAAALSFCAVAAHAWDYEGHRTVNQLALAFLVLVPPWANATITNGLVAYWKHEPYEQVAESFEQALAARPGYSLALFWLGSVYDRLGKTAQSTAALEQAQAAPAEALADRGVAITWRLTHPRR